MVWGDKEIALLKRLLTERLSYSQIGTRFGCSRQAISGAVRRHVYGIKDPDHRRGPQKRRPRPLRQKPRHLWTEAALTETWEERKARRAQEKADGQHA